MYLSGMEREQSYIFLNVPFADKDAAKRAGAFWDMEGRGWRISTETPRAKFERWLPRMFQPDARPPYIVSEMVPAPCWGVNLRSLLPAEVWEALRRECSQQAGHRCQVCGGRGPDWPVECNEQWQYLEDPATPGIGVQKLLRLAALCPTCHTIKHLGKAQIDGRYKQALEQLCYVNGWSFEQTDEHAEQAFDTWERRSGMEWHFDLGALVGMGIDKIVLRASPGLPPIAGVDVVLVPDLSLAFGFATGALPF
ncbi:hypothetical protein BMIN10S_03872 [Bosea minatitlanensis]